MNIPHSNLRSLKIGAVGVIVFLALMVSFQISHTAWANSEIASTAWSTYADPLYGFSLEYPTDWDVLPRDDSKGTYGGVLTFAPHSAQAGAATSLRIVIGLYMVERDTGQPLAEWTDRYQQSSSLFKSSEITIQKPQSIQMLAADNHEAVSMQGVSPLTPFQFINIPRGKTVWFIWTNAADQNDPIYEHVVNSFQFGKLSPRALTEAYGGGVQAQRTLPALIDSTPPAILTNAPAGYRLPFTGKKTITTGPGCSSTHTGSSSEAIDYSMTANTSVKATYDGQVISEGWDNTGYGNLMQIYHSGNYYSWYAHLNSFAVSYQQVGKGQVVAYSGSTGNSTGPHLHFEVRTNNQSVWIRTLPTTTWSSGDSNTPCWTGADGYATGP
jgi:murein DD-endopeptidase MepM/ murein hydrolase activator NlpD